MSDAPSPTPKPRAPTSVGLTTSEADEIIKLVEAKGIADAYCEMCNNQDWVIHDHLVAPPNLKRTKNGVSFYFGGAAVPSVAITCTNCGNTKLLALAALGGSHLVNPHGGDDGSQ